MKFIALQPGVWLSIAMHALAGVVLAFSFPKKLPRPGEGVIVTIIPSTEFLEMAHGVQTAKGRPPLLGRKQGKHSPEPRRHTLRQQNTVKSARPAQGGIGQSRVGIRHKGGRYRLSASDQFTVRILPRWTPGRESHDRNLAPANFRMNTNILQPAFRLGITGTAADEARDALFFLQRGARERNEVHDLKVVLSDPEDRVKLTLREADSSYIADFDSLQKKGWRVGSLGSESFASSVQGAASHRRIDLSAYKSDLIEVSGFAAHTEVDATFESFAVLDPKSGKKDEFSIADRISQAAGASLRIGSITLGTSLTKAEKITGIQNPTSITPKYSIALDLADLRKRMGNLGPNVLWTIFPSSLYVTYSETKNDYGVQAHSSPDYMGAYAAGASWIWSNGYANINYYYYQLDSGRSGDASYDSAGNGFSGNVGIWANKWTIDGGLSLGRTDELAPLLKSNSKSRDSYLSATYKTDGLPDFSIIALIGDYGYDQSAYDVHANGTYSALTFGFNFAKFIWPSENLKIKENQEKNIGSNLKTKLALKGTASQPYELQTFYRLKQEATDGSGSKPLEHVLGVVFRTPLN